MSYAIIGLVFVLLIVFGVLSAKNWHWLNIVFLILTFVAGVAASGAMAKSFKLRQVNMSEAERWEKQKVKNEQEANIAIVGPPSISYDSKSLRGINELLTREMHGRGRVWSGGTVTFKGGEPDQPNRIFKFSAARESVDATNQLKGILLYAFADQPVAADNQPLPIIFIGTFRVIEETPEQIEIEPIFITGSEDYSNPAGSWSMFEKMPADRRDAFKKIAFGDKSDLLDDNFDIGLYRQALETIYFPAEKFGLEPESAEYEALIDRYLFDGMKLGEIANYIDSQPNRKNVRFEPSPDEVFVEYRFDQKVDAEFDVDAPGSLGSAPAFQNGKAIDPALQAGKKIGFAKDESILIDQLTADGYQRLNGDSIPPFSVQYPFVTELDRYYFRQMRDYPFLLSDLERQVDRFAQEIVRAKEHNKIAESSLNDALQQSNERGEIIVKLDQDRRNLQQDFETITDLFNERTKQLTDMQQRSRQLDQQIANQYKAIQSAAAVLKKVSDTD